MNNDSDLTSGVNWEATHSQYLSSPTEARSPSWVYDQTFGIIHQEGCRVCRKYMIHVSDATLEQSFAIALHDRDEQYRSRFTEGFRRGRSAQQEHDSERLRKYRAQRDEARELEAEYKRRAEEAEELITEVLSQLRSQASSRIDDFHMVDGLSDSDSEAALSTSDYNSDTSSSSQTPGLLYGDEDIDDSSDNESYGDVSTPSDGEEVELDLEQSKDAIISSDCLQTLDNSPSDDVEGATIQLNGLSLFAISDFDQYEADVDDDDHYTANPLQRSQSLAQSFTRLQTPTPAPQSTFDSLMHIRQQMQLAHEPDNLEILSYVKSLVSEAHDTPHYLRTPIQKVLLTEWRRPSCSAQLCMMSISVDRTLEISPEHVYVDASGVGLGFFFRNQWQAWRLTSDWREPGRDIQWAEAVAVELGIRLMIQAGYSGRRLTVWSDNQQVVDAIKEERPFAKSHASRIVDKIERLCRKYQIDLEMSWVPGTCNPADGPSRLHPIGGKATRFPHRIDIPEHLQDFVYSYKPKP